MQIVFDMNDLFKPHSRFIRHLNHYRYIIQIPNEISILVHFSESDFCFQKNISYFQKEDFRSYLFRCELTKVFRDLHGGFFLYPRKVAYV